MEFKAVCQISQGIQIGKTSTVLVLASCLVIFSQLLGLNRQNTPIHDWFLKPTVGTLFIVTQIHTKLKRNSHVLNILYLWLIRIVLFIVRMRNRIFLFLFSTFSNEN